MKLDSKYFDSIRISDRKDEPEPQAQGMCQWRGCDACATHRAPRGRGRDGQYFLFCLEHVRQFNASYNYFQGMSDAEVEAFAKSAITGHRPTWRLGENGTAAPETGAGGSRWDRLTRESADLHDLLRRGARRGAPEGPVQRTLKPLERKAMEALHLPETADKPTVKARFKELVKLHHPDANGGDKGSEEKLREIIQAYNYLKQAGLV
jgi:DnaJ domain